MTPNRLKKGDHVRIIAPAESLSRKVTEEVKQQGVDRLQSLGLKVSFGNYIHEKGSFQSASVQERLEDLHVAFDDDDVQAVLSANGGSSANQLLNHINYDLIKKKPKIFCGLSDITEITSAVYTKTGLITYYGPHFTMLATAREAEPMLSNMKKTFFSEEPLVLEPSKYYSNSEWEDEKIVNTGFWTINEGQAEGICIGGNLLTLNFLLGNEFVPPMRDCILFLEENKIIDYRGIQKEIQQILNRPQGKQIKGLVIGRFQRESKMSRELLTEMIHSKQELEGLPVIGNVDCGHTAPIYTFPFGGTLRLSAKSEDKIDLELIEH